MSDHNRWAVPLASVGLVAASWAALELASSPASMRDEASERAAAIIYCDAPGALNSDVTQRPYRRLTRPVWPLDDVIM